MNPLNKSICFSWKSCRINVRRHQRSNHEWTIQKYWAHKTQNENKQSKQHNTTNVGHHYTQKAQ